MLSLRLPAVVEARLEDLARRTGRSKSYYAREAILEHLEELEDLYLAEGATAEHLASGGQTITMDEAMDTYGR